MKLYICMETFMSQYHASAKCITDNIPLTLPIYCILWLNSNLLTFLQF